MLHSFLSETPAAAAGILVAVVHAQVQLQAPIGQIVGSNTVLPQPLPPIDTVVIAHRSPAAGHQQQVAQQLVLKLECRSGRYVAGGTGLDAFFDPAPRQQMNRAEPGRIP